MRRLLAMRPIEVTPGGFFLVAGILGGLAVMVATPPFQVPDEPAHFYRAFSLSEGTVLVERRDGMPGAQLPASLHRVAGVMIDDVPFHLETRLQQGCWQTARAIELEPARQQFLHFPTASQFSALPYVPQAIGIAVGRWIGATPLALLFFGRAINLLVAVALIYFAVRQLPGYRWLAVMLALTPMAMFLRSSVSADALTTAIAFVYTATLAKLAFGTEETSGSSDLVLLLLSSAALCLTKPVYFPLLFGLAVIPRERFPAHRRRLVLPAIVAVATCTFIVALVIALPSVNALSYYAGSNFEEALRHPFHVAGLVVVDAVRNGPRYAAQFIGRLGWMDTPLPVPLVLAYFAFLVVLTMVDTGPDAVVRPRQRLVLATITALSILAVGAAMYVLVGSVEGIQGRYYHPVALAAAWVFHTRRWESTRASTWTPPAAVLVTVVSLVVTVWTIVHRYY